MILPVIAGMFAGAAMQPLGTFCARGLLSSRGKSLEITHREAALVTAVLACFGACIGLCAPTIPEACMLFALLLIADAAASADYHQRIIPNQLVLGLFAVRTAFGIPALLGVAGFPAFDLASALLGCVICTAIFALPALAGKSVGAGDIKFVAAMGFCLGVIPCLYALALMGVLVFLYMLCARRLPLAERLRQLVPMAPFACLSMMVMLLVQASPLVLT